MDSLSDNKIVKQEQQQHDLFVLTLQRLTFSLSRYYTELWRHCQTFEVFCQLPADTLSTLLPKASYIDGRKLQTLKYKAPLMCQAQRDLQWIEDNGIQLITIYDDHYPELLKNIDLPPPVLMAQGELRLLHQQQIAIVGSRKASPCGLEYAQHFASMLAQAGLTVTSGLALGIDGAAHRGALQGNGKTIAIIATGLDQIYPSRHKKLAEEITQQGLIISEFPLGTGAKRENFPRRNRIISGLSHGVLVAEAEIKSGSLITARCALEQGRDVWAIPGSPKQTGVSGCNHLIQSGAALVETPQDILTDLDLLPFSPEKMFLNNVAPDNASNRDELDVEEKQLLQILTHESQSIDKLIGKVNLTCADLTALLINMEIKGWVDLLPNGYCLK